MSHILPGKVFMAPMAGITDQPMRQVVHEQSGAKVVLVSEMVAINALSRKNPKTYRIADVRTENYPVIVQLVGSDPHLFADAAQLAAELGASGIDLNMGCPVRKIVAGGAGSALMKDPKLASKIIETTVQSVHLPVSVKFRKGWDNASVNAPEFAKMCEDSGASFITVHARTRAQGYAGKADWQAIRAVKETVKIPVVGNGDITDTASAAEMLKQTGADALMIGRAALGSPWLPGHIADGLDGLPIAEIDIDQIKQTLLRHIELLKAYYGDYLALPLSRKYVCWYSKNLRDAKRFRENYMKIGLFSEALEEIETFFNRAKENEA